MNVVTTLTNLLFAHSAWHGGMWGPGAWGGWGVGWLFGPILGVFWLAVAAVVIWFLVWRGRRGGGWGGWGGVSPAQRARDILSERYARGEISTEEYQERLGQLG